MKKISFLHGWGMNAEVFKPLCESMSPSYQAARINLPGYGEEVSVVGGFDEQLDQLADRLPAGVLVGWSLGGLYAVALAKRFPERFSRLILVASNPCFVERPGWASAMPQAWFSEFADSLVADWQATIKRFIGLQVHGAENARDLIRQITALVVAGGRPEPEVLRSGLGFLSDLDLREDLASLKQPVMTILGRRDKLVPASLADQLTLINPTIRVECLARSAHAPFLSHQAEFIELVDEFVESTQAG